MCEKGVMVDIRTARTKSHVYVGRLIFCQFTKDTISHQLLSSPCPTPPGNPCSGPSHGPPEGAFGTLPSPGHSTGLCVCLMAIKHI